VRKRLVRLCRESPFTALASGATFAVQMIGLTINQVRRESRTRAALLLNIMALWDDSTIISCYVKVSGGCVRVSPGTNQNGIFFFSIENKNLTLTPLNGGRKAVQGGSFFK
jgi:hypothetical protein